ncbi:hypothetical protein L6252_03455 [Candidatus Parcubacteria bacterium]|nr:hypothetical protein [Candidatus Parcubacteria bacterium]
MANRKKSRARKKRQKLARLKRNIKMPWKGQRQGFARPGQIMVPKKGKGDYKRQKFKKGGDMGNKSNDFVASLIKVITI